MTKKFSFALLLLSTLLTWGCINNEEPSEPDSDYTPRQARSTKRGLSYNFPYAEDIAAFSRGVSWFYNWGPDYSSDLFHATTTANMAFLPMIWNDNFDPVRIKNILLQHPECKYLLAYNEPNLTNQANMTPAVAAAKWPDLKKFATEMNLKIVSPAMNYGTLANYGDPIKWLDEFFELVPISDVDAIAIHCYMGSPSAVKGYVDLFRKYNKPLWMTEFCGWEKHIKSAADQLAYMVDVVNYFESEPIIERYAWFIPRYGNGTDYPFMQLLSPKGKGVMSKLGEVYNNLSSWDKNTHYPVGETIPAEHYSAMKGIEIQTRTDTKGILEVTYFSFDKWVEYPIEILKEATYSLNFRYASRQAATLNIVSNGELLQPITLEGTGAFTTWKTATVKVPLPKGKQTIRLHMQEGDINFNWWSIH